MLIAIKSSIEDNIKVLNAASDISRVLNLQGEEKRGWPESFIL